MDDDLLNPVKIDLSDYDDDDGNGDTDADNAAQSAASPPPQAPVAPPSNPAPSPEDLDKALAGENAPASAPTAPPASVVPSLPEEDSAAAPLAEETAPQTVSQPETAPVAASDDAPEVDMNGNKINRVKLGEEINLTRLDPSLKRVLIGMGWDAKVFADESTPDLDVSLFLLDKNDMTRDNEDFVFYNNLEACEGGVQHHGDNRTGAGDGDDENITITFNEIPYDVLRIEVVLSIYQGREKEQSFKDVENIFFRLVNADTTIELFRIELDKIVGGDDAVGVKIGSFKREGPNWFFEARAEPVERGLEEAATEYGIIVAEMV
ncbi:MAG: hypothetical protein CL561_02760 [Alphaproteobacteria bacterium]|nr:hypothetical protein [Alphaproteobacteria bacterium]|tara:strand:- start:721849 stop:722811 length:963 start_codon:yes stop_codon:yes gene_type:complete